ncbi:MAG: hypothetical protein AVDCRST_MAG23-1217 [uncultured Sphingosinicella sp.]|uniref:Fe2OG dioxygenase domain-containing protein n=1 Tax=uncultured Sphingosinicella sp. TaxID=478748 RepID=A0A6J4TXV8_9SPHN|nr:hypothetical protein [uncultured Sphingosinicella sp.]CAA9533242.1 MAG: hypothetical protein AVDCRST_MAG23-1217 [uncultured Sphingosinicella sp.]
MKVVGSYQQDGYAHLQGLISPEVAQAFLKGLKQDLGPGAIPLSNVASHPNLLKRAAFELYGHHYKPMLFFLWGLTPIVSEIVGRELLPTYDYFRIYREGDVCRVHSDRYSCEHSLSLTLDYSDGEVWDLEVEKSRTEPSAKIAEDFGPEAFASIPMQIGDAVLYQGVGHRHGRVKPNPNEWSAHLFLHWVDRDGPYREHAFDGQDKPSKVNFSFS